MGNFKKYFVITVKFSSSGVAYLLPLKTESGDWGKVVKVKKKLKNR